MSNLYETLERFQNRRRFPKWQPEEPYSPYHEQSPIFTEVIRRMLGFLDLELTVGDWIQQALAAANLTEAAQAHVERNARDEQKHDLALRHLAFYVGGAYEDDRSRSLVQKWQAQPPSFSLAYALEMGVFFSILPALTVMGDMYCVKVSQWISDDEGVHVLINGLLAKELGERLTYAQLNLVVETLLHIFEPMGTAYCRQVCERAVRRLKSGKDPLMMEQSLPVTPAFFEQVDKRSIVY